MNTRDKLEHAFEHAKTLISGIERHRKARAFPANPSDIPHNLSDLQTGLQLLQEKRAALEQAMKEYLEVLDSGN